MQKYWDKLEDRQILELLFDNRPQLDDIRKDYLTKVGECFAKYGFNFQNTEVDFYPNKGALREINIKMPHLSDASNDKANLPIYLCFFFYDQDFCFVKLLVHKNYIENEQSRRNLYKFALENKESVNFAFPVFSGNTQWHTVLKKDADFSGKQFSGSSTTILTQAVEEAKYLIDLFYSDALKL